MARLLASREYKESVAGASVSAAPPQHGATAAVPVTVTPMHVKGSVIHYPRVHGLADPAIAAKANAILLAREQQSHKDRDDCLSQMRDMHRQPDNDTWVVQIDVRYVSVRYASLDVRESNYCGGPYPNDNISNPLTLDFTTGAELDWKRVFKPGALPDANTGPDPDHPPALVGAYITRVAKGAGGADPECQSGLADAIDGMFVWLDARRGVVLRPDLPHAIMACANEIAFTPDEIAPYVRDEKFLADLRRTMTAAHR
jgi:hypothetical protein